MSILLTFLHPVMLSLLGICMGGAHVRHEDYAGRLRPIGRQQTRTICAALCVNGLGGKPCGAPCDTLTPRNVTQSGGGSPPNGTLVERPVATRRNACPLLCKYRLGEPLCECGEHYPASAGQLRIDYHRICSYFCSEHRYHILGCPECSVYRMRGLDRRVRPTGMEINWEEWCKEQCSVGLGGVACDCSLPLPMVLSVQPPATTTKDEISSLPTGATF